MRFVCEIGVFEVELLVFWRGFILGILVCSEFSSYRYVIEVVYGRILSVSEAGRFLGF